MQPVTNETFAICKPSGHTRFRPKPPFKRGQRTSDAEPSLSRNDSNRCEMSHAKPQRVYPAPVNEVADEDEHKSAYHERNDCKVQRKHSIRELSKDQSICHGRGVRP